MTTQEGPNHLRNLAFIAGIFMVLLAGWNALGAYQCWDRGGDITRNGLSLGCKLDFSK